MNSKHCPSLLSLKLLPALLAIWIPAASAQDARRLLERTFTAEKIDDISIGYGLAVGDVDGDGRADVLLADKKELVWYQNPDWQRHVIAARLSLKDNVCLAARDIDGDGKVEIAAGANWNPSETSSRGDSGSVLYLIRTDDVTKPWKPVRLPHDPTTHRMHWVRDGNGKFLLVVLPLHGVGNRGGQGENGVNVTAYHVPETPEDPAAWKTEVLDDSMHMTHNFDVVVSETGADEIVVGGREGIVTLKWKGDKWERSFLSSDDGYGEVRRQGQLTAGILPMHGNKVTVATDGGIPVLLDESLNAGHALAIADVLGKNRPQIIAGWRSPDKNGKVGIRLFVSGESAESPWTKHPIDDNTMACEDLKVADLNGDGHLDIIAAGRATKNLVIYWNEAQ